MNDIYNPVLGLSTAQHFAVETYRLGQLSQQMGNTKDAIKLRHSVRQLTAELDRAGISYHDVSGQVYDPGLSVDIVDCPENTGTPFRIREMLLPIILWGDQLLNRGQVILEEMPAPKAAPTTWQREWSRRRNAKRARKIQIQPTEAP